MYRNKQVEEALLHVVGWERDVNPSLQIAGRWQQSESGLTYQASHSMCNLGMIESLVPPEWERGIPSWSAEEKVYEGELRKHGGYYWKSKQSSVGQEPPVVGYDGDMGEDYGSDYWMVTTLLSEKVEQLTRRGVQNAVQRWMTVKKLNRESRTLLERRVAFDGAGRLVNTVVNRDKIVGMEINTVRGMGVTTKIDKVGLQFNGPGVVKLMVFHSSQREPVYSCDCEYSRSNGTFMWYEPEGWYLPYMGPTGVGGSWYMVYAQRDLEPSDGILMEAVKVDFDWSRGPGCQTCNAGMIQAWQEWGQYVDISPLEVSVPEDWDGAHPQLWDISNNVYPCCNNFGLNVMLSVMCDLTDVIINNRLQFASVLQKQVAYEVLKAAEMNPDVVVSRRQTNLSHGDIRYELDGSVATHNRGLGAELERAYSALEVDTQGMDKICLGCKNRGIRFRTA